EIRIERLVPGNHRHQFGIFLESRYQCSLNLAQIFRPGGHDMYLDWHFHWHAVLTPEPVALSRHLPQLELFLRDLDHSIIRYRRRYLNIASGSPDITADRPCRRINSRRFFAGPSNRSLTAGDGVLGRRSDVAYRLRFFPW